MSCLSNAGRCLWCPLPPEEIPSSSASHVKAPGLCSQPFGTCSPALRLHSLTPAVIRGRLLAAANFGVWVSLSLECLYPCLYPTSIGTNFAVLQPQLMCLFEVLLEIFSPPSGSRITLSSVYHLCSYVINIDMEWLFFPLWMVSPLRTRSPTSRKEFSIMPP